MEGNEGEKDVSLTRRTITTFCFMLAAYKRWTALAFAARRPTLLSRPEANNDAVATPNELGWAHCHRHPRHDLWQPVLQ
jgi:hypothetical protein